jgi:hypothetical protein
MANETTCDGLGGLQAGPMRAATSIRRASKLCRVRISCHFARLRRDSDEDIPALSAATRFVLTCLTVGDYLIF